MYLLFKYKGMLPAEYIKKSKTERLVLSAFMEQYLYDLDKEYSMMGGE